MVTGFVTCDNIKGLDQIKKYKADLIGQIEEEGLQCKYIYYSLEQNTKNSFFLNTLLEGKLKESKTEMQDENVISTNSLYNISKKVLLHIKTIEL